MPDCVWEYVTQHVGASGAALYGSWLYRGGDESGCQEAMDWIESLSPEDIVGLQQLCRISFMQVENDLLAFLEGPDEIQAEFREQYELKLALAEGEKRLINMTLDALDIWELLALLPFNGVYKQEFSKAMIRRGLLSSEQEPLDPEVEAANEAQIMGYFLNGLEIISE
jgi:hypothetical protein